jgi:hypothetical protein
MALNVRIHDAVEAMLCEMLAEEGVPLERPDPFGIDHDCLNPTGHAFIGSCSDLVCQHCGRIAWQ